MSLVSVFVLNPLIICLSIYSVFLQTTIATTNKKQHTLQATRQQSQRNTDRQVNPVDLYHIEVFHSLTDVR